MNDNVNEEYDDNEEKQGGIKAIFQNNKKIIIILGVFIIAIIGMMMFNKKNEEPESEEIKVTIKGDIVEKKTLGLGNNSTLKAEVKGVKNAKVKWESSDKKIIEVDESSGKIKGNGLGTATITAKYNDSAGKEIAKDEIKIKVIDGNEGVKLVAMVLTPGTLMMSVTSTFDLSKIISITPQDAEITSREYKSEDTSIAIVTEEGEVTAIKEGTTRIEVTVNKTKKASIDVVVSNEVNSSDVGVEILPTRITFLTVLYKMPLNQTNNAQYELYPVESTDKYIKWSSSDTSVVTVDQEGKMTSHSMGNATITAKGLNGVEGKLNVEISGDVKGIETITLPVSSIDMKVGTPQTVVPIVSPSDASNKILQFKSSDFKIVSFQQNTGTEMTLIAHKGGTATVTVVSDNGVSATLRVNVENEISKTANLGKCSDNLVADGSTKTLVVGGSHIAKYDNNEKSSAGTYTVVGHAEDGYAFSDGSTRKEITCTLSTKQDTRTVVPIPTSSLCNPNLKYLGREIDLVTNTNPTSYNLNNYRGTDAKEYTVTAILKDVNNYKWSDNSVGQKTFKCTIAKASVAVPTSSLCNPNLSYTGNSQDLVRNTNPPNYTLSGYNQKNAGNHQITATLKDSNNYKWSDNSTERSKKFTCTIPKVVVAIPTNLLCRSGLIYTGRSQNLVTNANQPNYTLSGYTQTNAGDHEITATLKDTTNYKWADDKTERKTFKCTISCIPLKIKAQDQTITYGESMVSNTGKVDVFGLVEGDSLSGVTLTANGRSIVPTNPTTQKGIDNYDVSYENGTLTTNKKRLTVRIDSCQNKPYDGNTNATCNLSVEGVLNSDGTPTISKNCTFQGGANASDSVNQIICTNISIRVRNSEMYIYTPTDLTYNSAKINYLEANAGSCDNLEYNYDYQNLLSGGVGVNYVNNSQARIDRYKVLVSPQPNYKLNGSTSTRDVTCEIKPINVEKISGDSKLYVNKGDSFTVILSGKKTGNGYCISHWVTKKSDNSRVSDCISRSTSISSNCGTRRCYTETCTVQNVDSCPSGDYTIHFQFSSYNYGPGGCQNSPNAGYENNAWTGVSNIIEQEFHIN